MTKPKLTEYMQALAKAMENGTGKERLDALATGATLISFIPRLVVALEEALPYVTGYTLDTQNKAERGRALLSEISARMEVSNG